MTDGWVAMDDVSLTGATVTKYYYLGGQRVAMRQGGVLTYLHGDHLGSASLATNASGAKVSEQRYLPYGGTRSGSMPTDRQFTGQRGEASLGFYDYVARQYDPVLGRFLQADTIIPDPANPQSLNRYAYTLNNPLRYADPSGHVPEPPHRIPQHGMVFQPGDRRELLFLGETFPYSKMSHDVGGTKVSYGSLIREIDNYLWEQVPAALGVYVKGDLSGGVGAGIGVSAGKTYLFNWRSGEMGVITGSGVEAGLYVGEETTWGGGAGLSLVRGASTLKACAGSDWNVSISADATAVIGAGIDYSRSYSAGPRLGLEVDSFSGRHITGDSIGISTGVGQGAVLKFTGGAPFMNYSWVNFRTDLPAALFSAALR